MITTDILKQQVLLEGIDEAGLSRIAGITKHFPIKKGEQLFKEKDETKGLWLIQSGKIEISRMTADGWRQTLVVLPAGHFFGELSILENRKHVATATALEDSVLLLIPKEDFDDLVQKDCALALKLVIKLAIAMSKNLRRMNDKFLSALISY